MAVRVEYSLASSKDCEQEPKALGFERQAQLDELQFPDNEKENNHPPAKESEKMEDMVVPSQNAAREHSTCRLDEATLQPS